MIIQTMLFKFANLCHCKFIEPHIFQFQDHIDALLLTFELVIFYWESAPASNGWFDSNSLLLFLSLENSPQNFIMASFEELGLIESSCWLSFESKRFLHCFDHHNTLGIMLADSMAFAYFHHIQFLEIFIFQTFNFMMMEHLKKVKEFSQEGPWLGN